MEILGIINDFIQLDRPSNLDLIEDTLLWLREAQSAYMSDSIYFSESLQCGIGVFAKEYLAAGTVVMIDFPIVSVPDVRLSSYVQTDQDGGDSLALIRVLIAKYSSVIENCLRKLYPVRGGLSIVFDNSSLDAYGDVLEKLSEILPCDISPHAVVSAVQLNSMGFYTFPELAKYDQQLRFLTGTALYPNGSMFNHSCDPNVSHYSIGDVAYFRLKRDVQPGQELCISYIGSDLLCESKSIRDEFLVSRDFVCNCRRCGAPENKDDEWLEELDIHSRVQLKLFSGSDQLIWYINNLLTMHKYIHKDVVYLKFLKCRAGAVEDQAAWQNLIEAIDPSDFLLAVVLVHYTQVFGVSSEIVSAVNRVAALCLGPEIGSFDFVSKLVCAVDLGT